MYEQLLEQLVRHVHAEQLAPGSRLPSERALAQALGVSRNTLKQAILVLEVQGIVEVRHGDGMYLVRDVESAEALTVLKDRRTRLPDVLDAREAIETKLAELAAERRNAGDMTAIDTALDAMAAAIDSDEPPAPADQAFHAAVVAAAHSPVLAGLYEHLADAISETRLESLRQPGRPSKSLADHRAIAEAIRASLPVAAALAARHHVETVRRVRLLNWSPSCDPVGTGG